MIDINLALMIDHTLLKPEATKEQIQQLCQEAITYGFYSVCINPFWVPFAAEQLKNTPIKVCTVIGFPLGANSTQQKVNEAQEAILNGAAEIDMVLNIGAFKSKLTDLVIHDIASVVKAAAGKAVVKVILETGLLTTAEKIEACKICIDCGADFVKTSTGFGPGGATADDVTLMRNTVGPDKGVKASGGIRDYLTALKMIEAGANRLGTSSGIQIVTQQQQPTTDSY